MKMFFVLISCLAVSGMAFAEPETPHKGKKKAAAQVAPPHNHHNRIVFVFGAPYFWDAGWWYPAWGYDPNAYYAYDGPIYGYNDLPPDQVVANVQSALQEQGYYTGEVDGLLGPLTRAALAR